MPFTCFSYPADDPSGNPKRGVSPASPSQCQMTNSTCFRYPAETDLGGVQSASPGSRRGTNTTCFRY